MKKVLAIILGVWALTLGAASRALADDDSYSPVNDAATVRSAYSYVRATSGDVTVVSAENGEVKAGRNLPISTGDEISVSEDGRAEIALADGNLLEIGGGTHTRLESLASQQGDEDSVSAIRLTEGSVILSAAGGGNGAIPRIDTGRNDRLSERGGTGPGQCQSAPGQRRSSSAPAASRSRRRKGLRECARAST